MKLTQEQTNVLAHIVVDPTSWANHAFETYGEEAVLAKIEKYKPMYEAALESEGSNYKNRVQRDAENLVDI